MSIPYVVLILLLSIIVIVGAISQLKGSRGWWGERLIRFILSFLPNKYRVLNDVRVYANGRKCQIDHLVLSPYGIFVIETKSYLGLTSGYSHDKMLRRNVLGKNYLTRNPLHQNQYHLEVLEQALLSCNGFDPQCLKSVVVFGFGSIIRFSDNPTNVMMFYRLYSYIKSFKTITIPETSIKTIYQSL